MKTSKPIVFLLAVVLGFAQGGMARAESARDYHERGRPCARPQSSRERRVWSTF